MITSFLESNSSPTQGQSRKQNWNTIEREFMDNDGNMFPVKIDYEWTSYWGIAPEISVWSFDYEVNGKPNISDKDLCGEVKDLIRQEENCTVTFY